MMLLHGHNPDVLTCIANLSNDEVFTPPEIANAMLDQLADAWAADHDGENIWANPDVKFLDPFTKSGIFLREITQRLTGGLARTIPDLQERVNHILTKQVYGIAITRLTAMLARRSVYCSKWASREHSICTAFDDDAGNIWFERTKHTWTGGTRENRVHPTTGEEMTVYTHRRCAYCGAGEDTYNRGEELESHAYAFIHTDNIQQRLTEIFGETMQFDVVIGNPPYQLTTEGHGNQATPIYQKFIEQARNLDPHYMIMITPSRWFSGGMGLDDFRKQMLDDRRLQKIVDYPKLYDAFPGVKIRGGVSYFLWNQTHDDVCEIQTIQDGKPAGLPAKRPLNEFDILVRSNEAMPILRKVNALTKETLDAYISSQKPFGLPTNFKGREDRAGISDPVRLYANQRTMFVERKEIVTNSEWVDEWKVLMTRIQGTSAAVETRFLSLPIIAKPGTACTETYIVAGHFPTETQAQSLASYLRTRFLRFLVSLRKPAQNALKPVYGFVPVQTWDREWTDEMLYEKYDITDEEIAFIESIVRPMETE